MRVADRDLRDLAHARAGRHRGRDRRGEHTGRLTSVARLMRAGDVDRLGVRAVGVAGVRDADRRHVHRRAAVHHVADAGLARIGVRVMQLRDEPLLREEEALQQRVLALHVREPADRVHEERHEDFRDVVRVQMPATLPVDLDERERHERVVGDPSVALLITRRSAAGVDVRRDDPRHRTAVALQDLLV